MMRGLCWRTLREHLPGCLEQLDDAVELFGLEIEPELIIRDYLEQVGEFTRPQTEWMVTETFKVWDLRVAVRKHDNPGNL